MSPTMPRDGGDAVTEENPGAAQSTDGTPQADPSISSAPATDPSAVPTAAERLEAIRARRRSRNGRGLLKALAYGIGTGLLVLVIGLAVVTVIIPKASGATTLTVLTGSMRPKLPPGTLLVVKSKPLSDIHIGNVITYEPNPDNPHVVISHRVVAITSGTDGSYTFTTKGDNNNTVDPPVSGKQVVAVLWYSVPWMGWIANGRSWIVVVIAVLLLVYAGYTLLESRRRRNQPEEDRPIYRPF